MAVPLDQVMNLRQQGYVNDQIIQALQRDGFNSDEIYAALSQADIKGTIGNNPTGAPIAPPSPPGEMPSTIPPGMLPQQPLDMPAPGTPPPPSVQIPQGIPSEVPPIPPGMPPMNPYGMPAESVAVGDKTKVEELVEAVIDEKWNDLVKSFDRIVEWKDKAEAKINQMEQKIEDLSLNFQTIHESILGKVGDYDENLSYVSNEIKAMEKVFQKILPTLSENVNELSRLTKGMKTKK